MNFKHIYFKVLQRCSILIVLYAFIVFVFPLFWAQVLAKTTAHENGNKLQISQNQSDDRALDILVIGDSTALGQGGDTIQEGFSFQYAEYLSRKQGININITNIGVSGARVQDILQNQIPKAKELNWDVLMVSLGANDVTAIDSISNFQLDMGTFTQTIKQFKKPVIWLNIPDFISAPLLLPPLHLFLSHRANEFNDIINSYCHQLERAYCIDIFNKARDQFVQNKYTFFAKDLYHPSKNGYQHWKNIITEFVPDDFYRD
jgi:lysophospholipase L1-like esterase